MTLYPDPSSAPPVEESRFSATHFGLTNFGVNLTTLAPGAMSALRHAHPKQDEFIYTVQGAPTLRTNNGATNLSRGMCPGFGQAPARPTIWSTKLEMTFCILRPATELQALQRLGRTTILVPVQIEGERRFVHRDDTPY